jgi:hypothetical protein
MHESASQTTGIEAGLQENVGSSGGEGPAHSPSTVIAIFAFPLQRERWEGEGEGGLKTFF